VNEELTRYRALPSEVRHPKKATFFTKIGFNQIEKQPLQEAPSLCHGHIATIVWYTVNNEYIVQVKLDDKEDVFAASPCTFVPTFGMDHIDGLFVQDIEEYILQQELGRSSERLRIFQERDSVPIEEYLRNRSIMK